jgi:RNA polymerase sigma-70 factor, ECF subfamily
MVMEDPARMHEELESPLVTPRWAFEELFDAERTRLFGALCLLTGNRQEAEDLMQDAFVRVYERWDRVGSLDDPTGYLYRTAMNGFRSRYRRSVLALRRQLPPRERRDEIAAAERHADIVTSLAQLTNKQRAAVVLIDFLELSSEEAGALMTMSPGAVRTQASRARAELRRTAGEDDA